MEGNEDAGDATPTELPSGLAAQADDVAASQETVAALDEDLPSGPASMDVLDEDLPSGFSLEELRELW